MKKIFVTISIIIIVFVQNSSNTLKELKLLGNYTINELSEVCETKLCLLDANRLLDAATNLWTVNPCSDFKEFSMGNFIRYKALHDRYDRIGFLYDTLSAHRERQRKLLTAKIKKNESFVSKIAKNFFQKCVDSGLMMQLII